MGSGGSNNPDATDSSLEFYLRRYFKTFLKQGYKNIISSFFNSMIVVPVIKVI